ncbi:response regulator transcription factor [Sphingopyxis granuli]|uniref:response regulator transcription factor n=1 Tax=Sphingopyxis granuli TaxID=267128 RepID=UPI001BAF5DBC|nr:response regulator [Sphingopyxis granuli]QUM74571.1 response regulator transcription factor [Sphingopyxis granuli]
MVVALPVVYVVDDDEGMLESLSWLLGTVNIECRCCNSGADFLNKFNPSHPSCVVLDVRMPEMGGFELFEVIRERNLPTSVIFVTANGNIPMAVKALQHGAIDFVEKPYTPQEMLDRITRTLRAATTDYVQRAERQEFDSRLALLSSREIEVLRKVVIGKRSKTIAHELGISCKTVDAHRTNIRDKFRNQSLAALVNDVLTHVPEWRLGA